MKKRQDLFEHYLDEIDKACEMLQEECESDGECRYKKVVAVILLFTLDSIQYN